MNVGTTSTGARFQRIQSISRMVKIPMLVMFLYFSWILLIQIKETGPALFQLLADLSTGVPIHIRLVDLIGHLIEAPGYTVLLVIWYWKLAKLFRSYERGVIFASETVRCVKILGLLCAAQWLLGAIHQYLFNAYTLPYLRTALPSEVADKFRPEVIHSNMNLFPFSVGGINFNLLLAGVVIVLIAWIMDEGRKIKEEQELTV